MGRRRSPFAVRRRRRASGGDAAIGILVVAGIAIAALGIYLVVIGAIALFGWLASTIASKRSATTPQVVTSSIPSLAEPPQTRYQVILPVEPRVFDDATTLTTQARQVFAAWASKLPKAPRDASSLLRGMALRRRLIGRLTSRLDGRRFVWRSAPYRGGSRNLGVPTTDPLRLDPYNPPSDLRTRSSYLELCERCAGDGRCECSSCGASGRVVCTSCSGAGKAYGITKNGARRLLNCKSCSGKGGLTCHACRKGQLACTACDASGRIERWLDLEGGPRDGDIQVEPDGDLTRAFAWGRDGVPALADEIALDARILTSVTRQGQLTRTDLPADVPREWIDAHWDGIQARLQPGERVVEQTFTLLEVPSLELTYSVGTTSQAIELEGLRMLAPPITADHSFFARASSLRRFAYALALVPAATFIAYAARGPYFLTGTTAGVIGCAALACLILYVVVWHTTLGRAAWKWLGVAALPVAAATTLAVIAEPSAAQARKHLDAGNLELARAELEALGTPSDDPLWLDLHMQQALAATTCANALELSRLIPASAPQHQRARAHADALALREAELLLGKRDAAATTTALTCASDTARNTGAGRSLRARVQLVAARTCLEANDWTCTFARAKDAGQLGATAESESVRKNALAKLTSTVNGAIASSRSEKDLTRRVALQRSADALWTTYLLAESTTLPPDLHTLRTNLATDQRSLDKQLEIARQKQAREEQLTAAKADREARAARQRELQEQREEQRRERARAYAPLICSDGSLSPSCTCGRDSYRGCCSHHGGVAGCSAD